jgi:hypothetical protein
VVPKPESIALEAMLRKFPMGVLLTELSFMSYVPIPASLVFSGFNIDQSGNLHTLIVMELFLVLAIKLAKNLDDISISVSATEDIAGAVKTKNKFDMFVGVNSLLNLRIGSVGHLGKDWTYTRSKKK